MKSWMKFLVSFGTVLGTIIVIVATYFLSWAMSAVFVWVISKLSGFDFSIKIATGIWLVWLVIRGLFQTANKR